jgi:pantoate--beta-alanine ligase
VPCSIVREPDGLAMSSRNKYLSESERIVALNLKKAIDIAVEAFNFGERNPRAIESNAREIFTRCECAKIDYIECRDAVTLEGIDLIERPAVLALAVFIGNTRLIDNVILKNRDSNHFSPAEGSR